jgi:ubiquinone/menaquinone biosynthesis C-methylase UbiE
LQATLEVPLMVWALRLPRGVRMLEIGCGRGVALPVLARLCQPSLLVGVDIEPSFVQIAAHRVAAAGIPARVFQADAHALPFEDGSFEVVVDFGTCYHVADSRLALHEVARVLRAGGLFVHETRVSQHLAHPVRSLGRRLPWGSVPELHPYRAALLWAARQKFPARPSRHGGFSL